jgi:hypothetical protein
MDWNHELIKQDVLDLILTYDQILKKYNIKKKRLLNNFGWMRNWQQPKNRICRTISMTNRHMVEQELKIKYELPEWMIEIFESRTAFPLHKIWLWRKSCYIYPVKNIDYET